MQNLSLFESNSQPFIIDNHLSFNFNDYSNLNLIRFSSLTETKSYIPITSCVLEHILTTTNLTNHEKLYYLLADSLALISKNNGYSRSCALPSDDWAERLGCSRSLVFTMQSNLVKKGYFIINKDFDNIGRNKRNLIIPTLPASVFNLLNEKYPDRVGDHVPYNHLRECKMFYLDRTKLFIKLNYSLLKIITSNEYTNPRQKVMWLSFYTRCYKNYMLQGRKDFNVGKYSYNDNSSFSFISSYRELADLYSCNTKHLSKSIKTLEGLGFIKTQNIYIRKRCSDNDGNIIQERQDQSLWEITLSLPDDCILELEKVKNRSNLKLKDIKAKVVEIKNTLDPKLIEDYLILGGIKFDLNLEQSSLLKSLIDGDSNDNDGNNNIDTIQPLLNVPCTGLYIDSIMEELDGNDAENVKGKLEEFSRLEDIDLLSDDSKTLSTSSSLEALDDKGEKNDAIKSDPDVAKSGLLLNKDLILKIKDIKSNLGLKSKVLFNNFLKRFKKDGCEEDVGKKEKGDGRSREFNIYSELIRKKLKILPKDKADKARKFAYYLVSKGLANGYAASLSKHELAKQIIHHAASWKPTKLGSVSREKEIDTALSVAWKKIVGGTWQVPLELAKAEVLQYEFNAYRRKYQESGVLSHEAKALESDVNNLLGGWHDLVEKITKGSKAERNEQTEFGDKNNKLIYVMREGVSRDGYIGTEIYSNQQLGLAFDKSDILTTDILNINPLYNEMLINNDYRLSSGIEGCNSYEIEREVRYEKTSQQHSSAYYGNSESENNETDKQAYHLVDYEYQKTKQCNRRFFDLSHIPKEQKYLKVITSDKDDSMKLETMGGKEYFVKLKELEMNDQGEFVMTLRSVANKCFIDLSKNIHDNSLLIKEELKGLTSQVDLNLNGNSDLQAIATNNRTVKIDEAIENLLKTIRIGN